MYKVKLVPDQSRSLPAASDLHYFQLDLLPHARAGRAVQAEIMQVAGGRQFERRMPLLLQFNAADGARDQTERHEFELIPVLDVTAQQRRIELGLDAQEIGVGLGK